MAAYEAAGLCAYFGRPAREVHFLDVIQFDALWKEEHRRTVRAMAVALINEANEAGLLPIVRCPLFGPKER
jgi:hypothetical protein